MLCDKLQTERLIIRPLDQNLIDEMGTEYNQHQRFFQHLQKLAIDPTLKGWDAWIVQLKNGTYIGDIGFKGKPNQYQEIEVGYGFEEAYRGQGYATESVGALISYVRSINPELTIKAECLKENKASIRVLEKLGFRQIHQDEVMYYWTQ
ncbi:GNAT family N-acetyltransferase [Macrococcus bovicus]|uniref:N-acetyltransferase n=1 Tax=Macrococcus bovicus TaxID=69968 RepID=A0A4R6BZL3_9STAP|nr:GNAT family N-acetyltransferase [Macrococcus bovicus]TDM14004.1 N-acetyltransferase [Macrococcus bovicus]WJP97513.1 GNAT family N-acetyltransferase [Macrococcus bovicus]